MKARLLVVILLVLALSSAPASAGAPQRAGERIGLGTSDPLLFPADAAFHVAHGHLVHPDERVSNPVPLGRFEFRLAIDGSPQRRDFVEQIVDPNQAAPPTFLLFWVFNYPQGMTGAHLFRGSWLAPCEYAMANGLYPGPCANPAAQVEIGSRARWVIFE